MSKPSCIWHIDFCSLDRWLDEQAQAIADSGTGNGYDRMAAAAIVNASTAHGAIGDGIVSMLHREIVRRASVLAGRPDWV